MSEPLWIDIRDAIVIHDWLAAIEGSPAELRDEGLLESALGRPRQFHAYGDSADIVKMAAAYVAGIVRNHPFIDGNKRTGFLLGLLFLEMNDHYFVASEADAAQAVMSLAAGDLDEGAFASWMRANAKRL